MSGNGNDLVLAAGVLTAVPLLGLTGLLRVACRPRDPGEGAVVMDLGPEAPAIVDLLTDRFEVTTHAPAATLVDLAARRWVDIEEPAPDHVLLRVRTRPGQGTLTTFERMVLDRVHEVAGTGPAPAAALVKGTDRSASAWQRRFRNEVVATAKAAGLCRPRWSRRVQAVPMAAGVIAGGALYLGAADDSQGTSTFDRTSGLTLATVAVAVLAFVIGVRMARSGAVRETEAGLRQARAWLGVRRFLAEHGRFGEYPAASVRIWDRYLAQAVALDLAPLASRQLPFGAEDDRRAWSRQTGQWRTVTVLYPKLRPGWGRPLWQAGLIGLAVTIGGVFIGRQAGGAILDVIGDLPDSFPDVGWLPWMDRAVLAATPLIIAGWLLAGPLQVVAAVADLATSQSVEGLLLRERVAKTDNDGRTSHCWVAVDSGRSGRIRAYRVPAGRTAGLNQGCHVRVRATVLLGWVREIEQTATAAGSNPPAARQPGPDLGDPLSLELAHRAELLFHHRDVST